MAQLPTSIPKKMTICCNGTWQSAVSGEENSPSNMTRLARCLNRVAEQDGRLDGGWIGVDRGSDGVQ
jgi:hypothetical protein